jgi:N4-gp56 family major capsid protein
MAGFIGVQQYAGQVELMPGEFGIWQTAGYATRFIQTPDASITLAAGAVIGTTGLRGVANVDVYATEIYGMDAVGTVGFGFEHIKEIYVAGDPLPGVQLIFKARGSAGAADPLDELSTLGWKSWHAAAILNGGWIFSIHSGATAL